MTEKSIFVVEDDGIIDLNSYEMLTKSGYAVPEMFASGEELLDHLEQSELPDLILMDVLLAGGMDGIETARQVRDRYHVPVIFVTACSDDRTCAALKELAPDGWVVKPFIPERLFSLIACTLESHDRQKICDG